MLEASRIDPTKLTSLGEVELRALAGQLLDRIARDAREIHWRDAKIEKLTFEMAQLRRVKLQPRRAADPTLGDRPEELAVRRNADGRPARGRDHQLDPVSQAQRARSVRLSEGRADPVADA